MPTTYEMVIDKITDDLSLVWGEMAPLMIQKRLRDVGATPKTISQLQLIELIRLLREKTLVMMIGEEQARNKAMLYSKWVRECSAE